MNIHIKIATKFIIMIVLSFRGLYICIMNDAFNLITGYNTITYCCM